MAIQIPNVGTGVPADQTGDSPWLAMQKVADNFSDSSHAASKLVGFSKGQIPIAELLLAALYAGIQPGTTDANELGPSDSGVYVFTPATANRPSGSSYWTCLHMRVDETAALQVAIDRVDPSIIKTRGLKNGVWTNWEEYYTTANVTKDSNGFLKAASPIVKVHADKVVLNDDAKQQDVTFIKNGIGDYTINTVTGLSTDGWYIELPKDMNGNPKVAVKLSEVEGVITLKSYKRIFSMETFTFEPDLDNPLDIPDGRWIDIRLNEIDATDIDLNKEV